MDEYIQNLLDVKEYKDLDREVIKSYNRLNNANIEEDLKYCYKQITRTTKKKTQHRWLNIAGSIISIYSDVLPDTLINKAIAMYAKIEGIELRESTGELDDIQPKHMEKLIAQYEKFDKSIKEIEKAKGGYLVNGYFVPDKVFQTIKSHVSTNKKSSDSNSLNLNELVLEYLKQEGSKLKYSKNTIAEYKLAAKRLQEFLDDKCVDLTYIDYDLAREFQKKIKEETSEDRSNNIIGFLSFFFRFLVNTEVIKTNYFSKERLSRYPVDKKGRKINFTIDQVKKIFSGEYNIEREILDYFRFKLHTGVRLEEFYRLTKHSFVTIDNKICIVVDTAKGKGGITTQRVLVAHSSIHDLCDYKWIKKIQKRYQDKKSFERKVNRSIDKVAPDKRVSDHRFRGLYAYILNSYDKEKGLSASIPNIGAYLGHENNHKKIFKKSENTILVDKLMGHALLPEFDIYAKNSDLDRQEDVIRVFDDISDIFKYKDIKNLPTIMHKNSKIKKSEK